MNLKERFVILGQKDKFYHKMKDFITESHCLMIKCPNLQQQIVISGSNVSKQQTNVRNKQTAEELSFTSLFGPECQS